jgi:hypothetical protein
MYNKAKYDIVFIISQRPMHDECSLILLLFLIVHGIYEGQVCQNRIPLDPSS